MLVGGRVEAEFGHDRAMWLSTVLRSMTREPAMALFEERPHGQSGRGGTPQPGSPHAR